MVFQIQLAERQDAVPITRDYIAQAEARLRALEGGQPPAAAARRRMNARVGVRRSARRGADCRRAPPLARHSQGPLAPVIEKNKYLPW